MAKGRTIDEIRENMADLQIAIMDLKMEIEEGLPTDVAIILDGAVPGSLAWCRAYGLDPNDFLPECFNHRYASVFICDPLPFQDDGARDGDAPINGFLDEWLARDYSALDYRVVRVPVLPIQERLEFDLERLSDHFG
jgi:predicted ATPase